jgi:predicted peptidase
MHPRTFLFPLLSLLAATLSAQWETGHIDRGIDSLHYLISYPEGYERDTADWPLVLFLHGGGEGGSDLERVKTHGLPKHVSAGERFPFVTLAPQNRHLRGFWDVTALGQLLDSIQATSSIDPDRIYLTGMSRGGLGAWMLAMQYPGRFAALAPVCGAVPASYTIWIEKDLPIWAFHGADDGLILPSESVNMIEALRQRGMEISPRLTIYEGIGHNAWDPAYADPRLYKWMLSQRRK